VSAGDEVIVRAGTYAGFQLGTSGTSSAPIRFHAASTGVVINMGGPTGDGIRLQNASYVSVEGFQIQNVAERGIAHRGATPENPVHGLVIRGNTISATGGEGMYLSEVADSLIENNTIVNAGDHGIYLANAGSDGTTLRGNNISGSQTAGIHFNGDLSVGGDGIISGLVVENNILHHNGQNGLNMDGVQDSLIQNNLIYGNQSNGLRAYRIDTAQGPRNLRIINNTIHVPADGYWCVRLTEDLGGNVVFNNILLNDYPYGGSIALDHTAGFASAHNAVVNRFTPDRSDTILTLQQWQQLGYDAGSFLAQPSDLFVNPTTADYTLKAGSPAIDAGLATFAGYAAPTRDRLGVLRPIGAAIDLGAHEFAPQLTLYGAPGNRAIHLSWTVNATPPVTSTWRIEYSSQTGTAYLPITGITNTARVYTLIDLTNYSWYTVTLNAMLDSTPFLTDTVRVMPTDRFVCLPLITRGN
jgi:parallel beta-helix repeat protein